MKNILLIDDCEDFRETTKFLLTEAGYDVFDAPTPLDAFPLLQEERFDLIVCDLHMPFCSGPEQKDYVNSYEVGVKTIREIHDAIPSTPIIAMSSAAPQDLRKISKYLDPVPAFHKPVKHTELLDLIEVQLYGTAAEKMMH